jgi:hypothetical protein
LDTDFKGDTGAERGLLENQGDELAMQGGGVADGASFYVGREMEKFARMRGAPFASGEEIVR